jgi:hypothetical protein
MRAPPNFAGSHEGYVDEFTQLRTRAGHSSVALLPPMIATWVSASTAPCPCPCPRPCPRWGKGTAADSYWFVPGGRARLHHPAGRHTPRGLDDVTIWRYVVTNLSLCRHATPTSAT